MSESELRATDNEYEAHCQMWEEIDACNKGAKYVVSLRSNLPAPSYTMSVGKMKYDHLDEDMRNKALAVEYNRSLANKQRVEEYWSRGRFFNAVGKTTESFHGMIWGYPSEKNIQSNMEDVANNITGSGWDVDDLAKDVTYQLILKGRYGALADMAGTDRELTAAEQAMPEYQPKAIIYKPKQILSVFEQDGKYIDIRLSECRTERVPGTYKYEDKYYTRRLAIEDGVYVSQLFNDKDELIEESIPRASGSPFTEIPFVFFGSDKNTAEYSRPPMFDLAHINMGHFVLDCDNRDNLHYHGQGTTVVTTDMEAYEFDSMNPAGLDTGAKGKNVLKQGDDIKLVQLEATGAIPAEMLRDEDRMIKAGAQIIQPNGSAMTLGQKKIESGSSLSTLARIAHNTSAGIEQLLGYLCQFKGVENVSTYKVNSKFITDEMTPELINAHIALVQGGALPAITLNETARRAGLTKMDDEQIEEGLLVDGERLTGESEEVARLRAQLEAMQSQE